MMCSLPCPHIHEIPVYPMKSHIKTRSGLRRGETRQTVTERAAATFASDRGAPMTSKCTRSFSLNLGVTAR